MANKVERNRVYKTWEGWPSEGRPRPWPPSRPNPAATSNVGGALPSQDGPRRNLMTAWLRDVRLLAAAAALCALPLGNCTSNSPPPDPQAMAPPTEPEMPASIRPEEVVGRWGYGSYHRDEDLKRTEVAARAQCGQPVVIDRGPGGGVMMYLADS